MMMLPCRPPALSPGCVAACAVVAGIPGELPGPPLLGTTLAAIAPARPAHLDGHRPIHYGIHASILTQGIPGSWLGVHTATACPSFSPAGAQGGPLSPKAAHSPQRQLTAEQQLAGRRRCARSCPRTQEEGSMVLQVGAPVPAGPGPGDRWQPVLKHGGKPGLTDDVLRRRSRATARPALPYLHKRGHGSAVVASCTTTRLSEHDALCVMRERCGRCPNTHL